jgi:SAM-dependent methyltransferase
MQDQIQDLETKQGEIEFRRLLAQQEHGDEICIPEAFSAAEIIPVLRESMDETRVMLRELAARGVELSPFLEIGAERGHRSYLLCNEYAAEGFAFDLSWDALRFGERLVAEFGFTSAPHRICGDAYHLPFRSHQFPFVFCFATLHHFPDPAPVMQELIRVLRDGAFFYFGGEPTRGRLALNLWSRQGHKLSPVESLLQKLGILGFISEGGDLERQYGISENTFPLSTWLKLVEPFYSVAMAVNRKLKLHFDPHRPSWRRWFSRGVGGVTSGLCRVRKEVEPLDLTDWVSRLRCPTCSTSAQDFPLELRSIDDGEETPRLVCEHCGIAYPKCDHVWMLLPRELLEALYGPVVEELCNLTS